MGCESYHLAHEDHVIPTVITSAGRALEISERAGDERGLAVTKSMLEGRPFVTQGLFITQAPFFI
jgi:hypothetical protein